MKRRRFLSRSVGLGAYLAFLADCRRWSTPASGHRVGISIPVEAEVLNEFYADMKQAVDTQRVEMKLILVDAAGDPVKQFNDIEAFIAQRFDAVFLFVLPEGMDRLVARAVDQGICVFNHSASPITGCTQNIVLDQYSAGYHAGEYAAQWINRRHPDGAEVGFLVSLTDPQLIVRSEGLKDGVRKNCPRAQFIGEAEAITVDKGADAAANMLQAHPNTKAILAFGDDPGIGAYTAALEAGKTNPDDFFVGSADGTRLGMDKVSLGSIYQCCSFFFFSFSATQAIRDMAKCLTGQRIPPTRVMGSKLITRENVNEYQQIATHPQAPEYQHFYTDTSVIRYSDVPLKSPKD